MPERVFLLLKSEKNEQLKGWNLLVNSRNLPYSPFFFGFLVDAYPFLQGNGCFPAKAAKGLSNSRRDSKTAKSRKTGNIPSKKK